MVTTLVFNQDTFADVDSGFGLVFPIIRIRIPGLEIASARKTLSLQLLIFVWADGHARWQDVQSRLGYGPVRKST